MRQDLDAAVASTTWEGPDADSFRSTWNTSTSQTLGECAENLVARTIELLGHADEQDHTSDPEHGGTPSGDWSAGGDGTESGYRDDYSDGDDGRKPLDPRDRDGDPEGLGDGDHTAPSTPVDLGLDEFTETSIHQRGIGDCWFLASLGAVARENPEFLQQHIRDNGDGTYVVTLYNQGQPVDITVDGTFKDGSVTGADGQPNWASIYEKAAAEYMGGSYDDLNGDQPELAFEMITGKDARYDDDASLSDIAGYLDSGPVAVDSKAEESGWWIFKNDHTQASDVVPNHSYIADSVALHENPPGSGSYEQMVHLRNPWGPGAQYGNQDAGDIWLTEAEFDANFRRTNYVENPSSEG